MEEREQSRQVRGMKKARTVGQVSLLQEEGQAGSRLSMAGKNEQDLGKALGEFLCSSVVSVSVRSLTPPPLL